jgi:hypothetical protein
VVNLKIPPLRERREDIAVLAEHFLERVQRETGVSHSFSDDAIRLMTGVRLAGQCARAAACDRARLRDVVGAILHTVDLPTQLQDFRMHIAVDLSAAGAGEGVGNGHASPGAASSPSRIWRSRRSWGPSGSCRETS